MLAAVGALLFISASMTAEVFYAKDVIGATDAGYALLYAAWMLGMVAGALALAAARPARRDGGRGARSRSRVQGAGMAAQTVVGDPPGRARRLPGRRRRPRRQERARAHGDRPARAARRHGRAFAAYNAARNAAEVGALGAGGLLVTARRRARRAR